MNAEKLEEKARRLLRAKILYHYRSLLEFDRVLGDPPNTVSQRLRGRVRLTLFQLLRYLEQVEVDPVDFMAEVCGHPAAAQDPGLAGNSNVILQLAEQLAAMGQSATRLLEEARGEGAPAARTGPRRGARGGRR
jgi:hypothetical protein